MRFTIPGEPCGKARPRVVRNGAFSHAFTPEKTINYENLIKVQYQQSCGSVFFASEALEMRVTAYYAIPASASKRKAAAMMCGAIRPTKKPDCDNVIKIIGDALNQVAYKDDSQIVCVYFEKKYAAIPKVEVELQVIGG